MRAVPRKNAPRNHVVSEQELERIGIVPNKPGKDLAVQLWADSFQSGHGFSVCVLFGFEPCSLGFDAQLIREDNRPLPQTKIDRMLAMAQPSYAKYVKKGKLSYFTKPGHEEATLINGGQHMVAACVDSIREWTKRYLRPTPFIRRIQIAPDDGKFVNWSVEWKNAKCKRTSGRGNLRINFLRDRIGSKLKDLVASLEPMDEDSFHNEFALWRRAQRCALGARLRTVRKRRGQRSKKLGANCKASPSVDLSHGHSVAQTQPALGSVLAQPAVSNRPAGLVFNHLVAKGFGSVSSRL